VEESRFSFLEFKFALLRCFNSAAQHQHRINVLGKRLTKGALEFELATQLTPAERALAAHALDDLLTDGFIRATYRDTIDPENWLEVTEAGKDALARGALDDLDVALASINPDFLEMRHGAWAALHSHNPDSIRQAAHSAREMFTQILDIEAPGEKRPAQIKAVMRKRTGRVSKSGYAVVETQVEAAEALHRSLHAVAHARSSVAGMREKVRQSMQGFEVAIAYLLGVARMLNLTAKGAVGGPGAKNDISEPSFTTPEPTQRGVPPHHMKQMSDQQR
jgi:hypothetical protein